HREAGVLGDVVRRAVPAVPAAQPGPAVPHQQRAEPPEELLHRRAVALGRAGRQGAKLAFVVQPDHGSRATPSTAGTPAAGRAGNGRGYETSPRRNPQATAWARSFTPSFLKSLRACVLTVSSDRNSSRPIWLLLLPWLMPCSTCSSRWVSTTSPACRGSGTREESSTPASACAKAAHTSACDASQRRYPRAPQATAAQMFCASSGAPKTRAATRGNWETSRRTVTIPVSTAR